MWCLLDVGADESDDAEYTNDVLSVDDEVGKSVAVVSARQIAIGMVV